MSMKVQMLDTGNVVEYEDSYAMRLIEQGDAVLVSGDTPVTPTPEPIDPGQYGELIEELQDTTASLQAQLDDLKTRANSIDNEVFANMFQSITQAQERKIVYDTSLIQEGLDAAAGNE